MELIDLLLSDIKLTIVELFIILFLIKYYKKFTSLIILIIIIITLFGFNNPNNNNKLNYLKNNIIEYNSFLNKYVLLENKELPSYSDFEVLVKVKSSTINPVDYKLVKSKFPFFRYYMKYHTVAMDFSGEIIAKGRFCSNFNIGDSIYGFSIRGSLQTYTTAVCFGVGKFNPKKMSHITASSLPVAGIGYQSLKRIFENEKDYLNNLKKNNKKLKILVVGASGACGLHVIQLAKILGYETIGICSNKNKELVLKQGANKVITYNDEKKLKEEIEKIYNEIDLIYDGVTPEYPYPNLLYPTLKKNNNFKNIKDRYHALEGDLLSHIYDPLYKLLKIDLRLYKEYDILFEPLFTNDFNKLTKIIENDKNNLMEPVIDTLYKNQLNEKTVEEAFKKLKSRRVVGKIVFTFD